MFYTWKPYVSVAQRKKKAQRQLATFAKKGHPVAPVVLGSRAIAKTFWGKSWCENLERYRDYDNRLPRGRTEVERDQLQQFLVGHLSEQCVGAAFEQIL